MFEILITWKSVPIETRIESTEAQEAGGPWPQALGLALEKAPPPSAEAAPLSLRWRWLLLTTYCWFVYQTAKIFRASFSLQFGCGFSLHLGLRRYLLDEFIKFRNSKPPDREFIGETLLPFLVRFFPLFFLWTALQMSPPLPCPPAPTAPAPSVTRLLSVSTGCAHLFLGHPVTSLQSHC